ncbi:PPK2 family polyphosphate kinase [Mesonia sp. K7]|uniref:PPK2 family polyphosphate kinase n=1 Tax=Mesonia sp. K7 TaxID=2218606 RepID=UPI000DA8E8B5|nr:PPK2 family polyphosphate kinase [Mesonia sp. K7]PZD79534.1 polyphosphate kinase 2 family protein [Mesonia sp. K7]
MKEINTKNLIANKDFQLKNYATYVDLQTDEKTIKKALNKTREALSEWQDVMYAHGKYAVLICLQGMDTAGKDSLIREVFQDFNSRGVVVHSFKTPSKKELQHDYLWRHYCALPERGKFSVFNRTHYENVLVTRVHPNYILSENIPSITKVEDIDETFWENRFEQIRNFENHIIENGIKVFKFFLHLSKEEQKNRLLRRLNKPDKNWKFSPGDLEERKLWDNYQYCYEEAIKNTTTQKAPWYVIPADDKATARYLVAKILYDQLSELDDVKNPTLAPEVLENLKQYINELEKE